MPTASETSFEEAERWSRLAANWNRGAAGEVWEDRPPTEREVVVHFDPADDLNRRASRWEHSLEGHDLAALGHFAAALAQTEAEDWKSGTGVVATRAYEARRFLIGERIIHWAVPWLDTVGRCYPEHRDRALPDRDFLLDLGDEMRVASLVPGREGLVLEGEDSFGPLGAGEDRVLDVRSLWSGHVVLDVTVGRLEKGGSPTRDLALLYGVAAHRWQLMARTHPGSAQIWVDLATRARATGEALAGATDP